MKLQFGRSAAEEGRSWLLRFVKISFQHFLLISVAYDLFSVSHSFLLLEHPCLIYYKLVRILVLNLNFKNHFHNFLFYIPD